MGRVYEGADGHYYVRVNCVPPSSEGGVVQVPRHKIAELHAAAKAAAEGREMEVQFNGRWGNEFAKATRRGDLYVGRGGSAECLTCAEAAAISSELEDMAAKTHYRDIAVKEGFKKMST